MKANSGKSIPTMLKRLEDIQYNLMRSPLDFVWMQKKTLLDQIQNQALEHEIYWAHRSHHN